MENPHEEQQSALLSRIVANVGKLNQSISKLNSKLESVNKYNEDITLIADMWNAYDDSVRIHLDNTKNDSNNKPE